LIHTAVPYLNCINIYFRIKVSDNLIFFDIYTGFSCFIVLFVVLSCNIIIQLNIDDLALFLLLFRIVYVKKPADVVSAGLFINFALI